MPLGFNLVFAVEFLHNSLQPGRPSHLLQADPNFWQRVTPFDTLADRVLALLRGQESPVAPPGDTTTAFLLPDRSTDIASARVLDANFNRCRGIACPPARYRPDSARGRGRP